MTTFTLPAGEYYIGDPCYVLQDANASNDRWSDFLDAFWAVPGYDKHGAVVQFEQQQVFLAHTAFGDGTYNDQFGNDYPVDAGLIGCVPIVMCFKDSNPAEMGAVRTFNHPVQCSYEDGTFYIGNIIIDTDWADEEVEWDGQPDEAQEWHDFDPDC